MSGGLEKSTVAARRSLKRLSVNRHVPLMYGRIARTLVGKANFDERKCAELLNIPVQTVYAALRDPRMQFIIQHRIGAITGDIDWCRNELAAFAAVSYDQMLSRDDKGGWKIDLDKARRMGALPYIRKLRLTGSGRRQVVEIEPYDRQRAVEMLARIQGIITENQTPAQNINIAFVPIFQENTDGKKSQTDIIDASGVPQRAADGTDSGGASAQTDRASPGDGK